MKEYSVKFSNGKFYNEFPIHTRSEAEEILAEAIADMDNDNWCGLHIEEQEVTFQEYVNRQFGGEVGLDDLTDEDYDRFYSEWQKGEK